MADFEILDHTSEVGILAYGGQLAEAFANAARGMFSLMADLEGIEARESRDIEVRAGDVEALLVEWLNELLYLFEVEHILFSHFEIASLDGHRLKARALGERIDPLRHRLHTAIKAVTYHMLKVEREDGFKVRVIFDI